MTSGTSGHPAEPIRMPLRIFIFEMTYLVLLIVVFVVFETDGPFRAALPRLGSIPAPSFQQLRARRNSGTASTGYSPGGTGREVASSRSRGVTARSIRLGGFHPPPDTLNIHCGQAEFEMLGLPGASSVVKMPRDRRWRRGSGIYRPVPAPRSS